MINELFAFLLRFFVDHRTVKTRIDIGSEADLRHQSRETTTDLSPNLSDDAEWDIVRKDLIIRDVLDHFKRTANMPVDRAGQKSILCQGILTTCLLFFRIHTSEITLSCAVNMCDSRRVSALLKTILDCEPDFLRPSGHPLHCRTDDCAIRNQLRCLFRCNKFCHSLSFLQLNLVCSAAIFFSSSFAILPEPVSGNCCRISISSGILMVEIFPLQSLRSSSRHSSCSGFRIRNA